MLTSRAIATLLFFGGWNAPLHLTFVPGGRLVPSSRLRASCSFICGCGPTLPRLRYDRFDGLRLEGSLTGGNAQSRRHGSRRGVHGLGKSMASRNGSTTPAAIADREFRSRLAHVSQAGDEEYPSKKKQHSPRFHGLHELAGRYADAKSGASGASFARALPCQCDPP